MAINFKNKNVADIKYGERQVTAIYKGSTIMWSLQPVEPEEPGQYTKHQITIEDIDNFGFTVEYYCENIHYTKTISNVTYTFEADEGTVVKITAGENNFYEFAINGEVQKPVPYDITARSSDYRVCEFYSSNTTNVKIQRVFWGEAKIYFQTGNSITDPSNAAHEWEVDIVDDAYATCTGFIFGKAIDYSAKEGLDMAIFGEGQAQYTPVNYLTESKISARDFDYKQILDITKGEIWFRSYKSPTPEEFTVETTNISYKRKQEGPIYTVNAIITFN